ncbi:MAG: hypothetical protein AB8W37_07285 [Arsenophonus endosymbiont of Dermacentor nuttalli]
MDKNNKLSKSVIKANAVKFSQSSFEMNNADIEFNVKLFENINSDIRSKDSVVTVNSEKFHNKDENRQW